MGHCCLRSLHRPVKQWSLTHPGQLQCLTLGRNARPVHPDLLPAVSPEDSGPWTLRRTPFSMHSISVHFFNETNYNIIYNIRATSDELSSQSSLKRVPLLNYTCLLGKVLLVGLNWNMLKLLGNSLLISCPNSGGL